MIKSTAIVSGLLALALTAPAAIAAPLSGTRQAPAASESLVEKTQAYHRSCYWTGTGWGYKHKGAILVCRPHKPRGVWIWHSEGPRHGWYHPHRKVWHHNKW